MSKILVYLYTTDKKIIEFTICYVINPSLHVNKVFIEQSERCLRATFRKNTMENIIEVMKKKNICVIALIMFYWNKGKITKKLFRVFSFVPLFYHI